jgi:RNA polymerase sigma factor for flagellar operon FliA
VSTEDLYLSQLETIESVIRLVCRHARLSATEAEEFASIVRLKLVQDDYAVLRKFQHRSSFRTFLTAVVQRAYIDYRNRLWGKWRPSAEARRLGDVALLLERLLVRDGLTFDEAVQTMRTNHHVEATAEELDAIRARLPDRARRVFVGDDVLENVPASTGDNAEVRVSMAQREGAGREVAAALAESLRQLDAHDRLLIKLCFYQGMTIAEVARMQRVEQKPLYNRLKRALAALRDSLLKSGLQREQILEVLGDEALDEGPAPD